MAKKNQTKQNSSNFELESKESINQNFAFTFQNILPLAITTLYLLVHFIGNFDAYDTMGPQWLYMVVLDFMVIIFILANKNEYDSASGSLIKNIFSKLYIAFFVLAGLSIFTAINPTEAWVGFVRLTATIIAYFNIAILFKGKLQLFKYLAQILGFILLFESFQSISIFINNPESLSLTKLIMSINGTSGNKNIFAAGLVVKVPFVLYLIHTSRLWGRILNMLILVFASLAIFILNARSSYLSLLIIVVLYVAFSFINYLREKKLEQSLYRLSYILLPIFAAFFISQIELTTVKSSQEVGEVQDFGSVTERLGSLTAIADESNQVRLRLWAHAIDYTKHHPFIGCGYSNWKIASIPYQRTITNDLYVPIHAHNDLIETFAELGIPGGLLYLSLFFCITLLTFKTYQSKTDDEIKLIAVFTFLAFLGYSIDAFFNFPSERPISQLFFALIAAFNVNAYLYACKSENAKEENANTYKSIYGVLSILLLIPAGYVTYLTYKSLIAQRIIIPDMANEPMKLKWQEIFPMIPPIPNISASAQPIDAIKGRYLYEAGKYEEALVLLNKGAKANPLIGYSEFLKAGLFFRQGKYDSAISNATVAFYIRPKAKTYFQTLIAILADRKDSTNIQKAFEEYNRYRMHPYGWDMYLRGMENSVGKGTPFLLAMADSALRLFPRDSSLLQRRAEIINSMGTQMSTQSNQVANVAKAQIFYNAGIAAFQKGQSAAGANNEVEKRAAYQLAASNFLKAAEITPGNYIIYENAAIAYFNNGEYRKSMVYFNKVIELKSAVDGKTEYFLAVALINLGKREEGCNYLQISQSKGYAEAAVILKSHCGK